MEEARSADVLIVGAGPAGLFTALFLARYGIKDIAIIERRPIPVQIGHASGIQPRTQEILHTLGLFDQFDHGSGGFADAAFWTAPTEDAPLKRSRAGRDISNETLPIHKRMLIQHQGRTEAIINAELEKRGIRVERPFDFVDFDYTDDKKYPIRAFVKDTERGQVDRWNCKYLVAADGANSLARQLSGIESPVSETDNMWIVADTAVETDFPDIRRRCPIRTARGNLMFIPSPHSTLRIYMLVTRPEDREELEGSRLENSSFHTESRDNRTTLLDVMQRQVPNVLKPYTLKIKQVRWISKYVVAQRVIEHFTDGKRCLFVGDSCHSHSPKAGQGMNTGIQDAYNLAWKLALVIRGRADPSLLQTYDTERKHIAHQLIDFDAKFASRFSDQSQIESPEFFNLWKEGQGFTSGLQHQYPPNPALSDAKNAKINPSALEPLIPGKRLLPMSLTRHIDGMPVTTLDTMPANGEFHTFLFAGDISSPERQKAFHSLYDHLTSSTSPSKTHNGLPHSPSQSQSKSYPWPASDTAMSSRPAADGPHSWPLSHIHFNADHHPSSNKLINLQVVHTADRFGVDLQPDFKLWKYNFYEDEEGREHGRHGVDPEGSMQLVVVRPDGFVAMVRSADGGGKVLEDVRRYLEGCGLRALKDS